MVEFSVGGATQSDRKADTNTGFASNLWNGGG